MAHMEITLFSTSLARLVDLELIYPCDALPMQTDNNPHYARPTKTLFLLHGYSNNRREWMLNGNVQQLAVNYNLAIVCPCGENSFYLNQKGTGGAYGDYVGVELVNFLRKTFGLAKGPEDTFIGGLSMGGFGALHVGLNHPENFGRIIALSSALIHHEVAGMKPGDRNAVADYDYYAATFGEPSQLLASRNNPETLALELKAAGQTIPGIFMACGTEDMLLTPNRALRDFFAAEQIPAEYHEAPGMHDFNFWNQWLEPGICWALGISRRTETE